jgi:hypothetical protein
MDFLSQDRVNFQEFLDLKRDISFAKERIEELNNAHDVDPKVVSNCVSWKIASDKLQAAEDTIAFIKGPMWVHVIDGHRNVPSWKWWIDAEEFDRDPLNYIKDPVVVGHMNTSWMYHPSKPFKIPHEYLEISSYSDMIKNLEHAYRLRAEASNEVTKCVEKLVESNILAKKQKVDELQELRDSVKEMENMLQRRKEVLSQLVDFDSSDYSTEEDIEYDSVG